jgi:hypothetical protein
MITSALGKRLSVITRLILLIGLLGAGSLTVPQPALAQNDIIFTGRVWVTDSQTPIPGVTIQLQTALAGSGNFVVQATTTTGEDGSFRFVRTFAIRTDYRLVEINPPGHVSTSAAAANPGIVITPDIIEFRYNQGALTAGTYGPGTFYDQPRVTPTPTPTNTPTRTPTATPTATPFPIVAPVDLYAYKIEVTQGIQDLNNSRRLVTGRRTFVRFYARSNQGTHPTHAVLIARRGINITVLFPLNNAAVSPSSPRDVLSRSFLFELPAGYRQGNVILTAIVNPIIANVYPTRSPVETTYDNNVMVTSVNFVGVPTPHVVIYRVMYLFDGALHVPPQWEAQQLASWIRRTYPISGLQVEYRIIYYGTMQLDGDNNLVKPKCGDINALLLNRWILDWFSGKVSSRTRFYGLVSDGGKFMRGCVPQIPSLVGSGPTGPGTWGWDFDGSYGDWYGGHEIAHAFGRGHANFCGAGGGPSYPYPNGRISPSTVGNTAMFGFDRLDWQLYGPTSGDVMSYCDNQWMGGFTWEGLMTYFQTNLLGAPAELLTSEAMDRLRVTGWVGDDGAVTLYPLVMLSNVPEIKPRVPGDWAIVLRGADGSELARYPFTPNPMESGPDPDDPEELELLLIDEMVPFVVGTTQVDIERLGSVVTSVRAGLSVPTVSDVTPSGGTLEGDTIRIAWSAFDADPGDTLTFEVHFSRDGGANWAIVAENLSEPTVEVDRASLASTTQGLFRVLATDGINTGSSQSAASFIVPNLPPVAEIVQPEMGATVAYSQTLALVGVVYDVDEGSLPDEQITWTSSRDGLLGNGPELSIETLSVGQHTITLRADDGMDGVSNDMVNVIVVESPTDLPAPADQLLAGPPSLELWPAQHQPTAILAVDNANPTNVVRWNATSNAAWILLSANEGETPDDVTVGLDASGLPHGTHSGTITLTSPDLPGESVQITVVAHVSDVYDLQLPLLLK